MFSEPSTWDCRQRESELIIPPDKKSNSVPGISMRISRLPKHLDEKLGDVGRRADQKHSTAS